MAKLPEPFPLTIDAIYQAYVRMNDARDSTRLGASQLGKECDRQLWYAFRWAHAPETFDGRKLRLFNTGHREELRMLADLRNAGVGIAEYDPATGEQWTYESLDGHLVAKLDGIGEGFAEAPASRHIIEIKTHNDRSWKEVSKKGVKIAKPAHYVQVQVGMHLSGIDRAYYLAHNKNTDDLYQERIAYDPVDAGRALARAASIIGSPVPPPKLHSDPSAKHAWQCNYCPARGLCHGNDMPRRNCRTCLSSTPVAGGFHCDVLKQVNDPNLQKIGCSLHLYIPDLVPGEQVNADPETRMVEYAMRDGSKFMDGGGAALPAGSGGPRTDDNGTADAGAPNADPAFVTSVKSAGPTAPFIGEDVA